MSSQETPMSTPAGQTSGRKHSAGAFDVRNVIAALIGFYGIVLVLVGIFGTTDDDEKKTGGLHANLWTGIAMIVFALAFVAWTWLRPIVVEPSHAEAEGTDDGSAQQR
jgi:hypothetical protein